MFNFIQPKVPQVSSEDLKKAIDTQEQCVILDVRTPGEYQKIKIDNSINLPVDKIAAEVLTVIPNKETKVYVYCLSGSRSVYAVESMQKLGFTNVFDVKQGLLAWRAKQYPTI